MIISVDELKSYLNITTTSFDTQLSTLIEEMQKYLEGRIGYEIEEASRADWISGTDYNFIQVYHYPIQSITSLEEYDSERNNLEQTFSSSDYFFVKDIIQLYSKIFSSDLWYKVVYTSGWSAGSYPEDLQLCLKEICAIQWRQRGYENTANYSAAGESLSFRDTNDRIEKIIEKYRKKIIL